MKNTSPEGLTIRMKSNAQWDVAGTQFVRTVLDHPERFIPHVVQDDALSPKICRDDVVVIDPEKKLGGTGTFAVNTPYGVRLFRLQRRSIGEGVYAITDYPERDCFELYGEPDVIGQVVLVLKKVV